MIPVTFQQVNHVTDGQGVVNELPNFRSPDGRVTSCWKLSKEDLDNANQHGLLWVTLFEPPANFVFGLSTVSPFLMPRSIVVDPLIVERVYLRFWDTLEIVMLVVDPEEDSFMVEQILADTWMVAVRNKEYGESRYQTNYKFGEALRCLGLANTHYGRFDDLLSSLNLKAETTLILERVNKTV